MVAMERRERIRVEDRPDRFIAASQRVANYRSSRA
jgi:hypothetical protein